MQADITNALKTLNNGQLLLYPTDTVWGIGCDATNAEAVKKVYQLKQRNNSKALICLVKDFEMLKTYVPYLPPNLVEILNHTQKPTSIIYSHVKDFVPNLLAEDGSVAIRICKTEFCQALLSEFDKPIVSTSANISGEPTPKDFNEISPEILKGVDYVVNLQSTNTANAPSQLLKVHQNGCIEVIRP
ncbi:L-threonylcarbamoyladenylate synthase [Psychroflexus sp. ALD_RP9]|uniref:L-threonylcarbamoyladenylate synthase n=1 Tax=Psychroflexus sp. ALD_RP9 TaxID=2777186 RepID=UPI001A8F77F9|nr:L-threonylcarbamoyladenylate synthase [Psychroflexus sp. ALD_RP9]QSS96937.1 threonylcarbamoyl-AMP synthase [Psychroflexus sp. ALD_RP9]